MNSIPLSPIDHIFTGVGSYPIEFVFAYRKLVDADRLLQSLEKVMASFLPVKSQIVNNNGWYFFEEAAQGFSFEVVDSKVSFDETENREMFINPVSTKEGEILSRFRLTQTPEGSVFGVSISHCVADGFSYFHFLTSWARVFHGKPFHPPVHDRALLIQDNGEEEHYSAEKILRYAGLFLGSRRADIQRDKLVWETMHIGDKELKSMLTEVQQECQARLSFNDVIVAALWKKYIPEWSSKADNPTTYISCPFDYRRLMEQLPATYFGNAVTLVTTELSMERLVEAKLSELAVIIRRSIGAVSEVYINAGLSALYSLNKHEGLSINEHLRVSHPEAGLLVTNLSRLPVKEIEFDAGPPEKYEILTPANRGAVILPANDGIEVRVCCPYE